MLTPSAISDLFDGAALHAETLAKHFGLFFASANVSNFIVRQFQLAMAFTKRHVTHVLLMRSKVQMLWIDAQRIVAFVADAHAFRNLSDVYFPRSAWSTDVGRSSSDHSDSVFVLKERLSGESMPYPAAAFCSFPFGIETNLKKLSFTAQFPIVIQALLLVIHKTTQMAFTKVIGLFRPSAACYGAFVHVPNYTKVCA